MLFLLQVAENKISLFSLLQKGGYIMYPLYLLLVIAIYVFFERMIAIKKAGTIDPKFMLIIRDNIISGNLGAAKTLAKNTDNPVTHTATIHDQNLYFCPTAGTLTALKGYPLWSIKGNS